MFRFVIRILYNLVRHSIALDLYYGIEYLLFEKVITQKLIDKYIDTFI